VASWFRGAPASGLVACRGMAGRVDGNTPARPGSGAAVEGLGPDWSASEGRVAGSVGIGALGSSVVMSLLPSQPCFSLAQ
jgi:hypothetical protein